MSGLVCLIPTGPSKVVPILGSSQCWHGTRKKPSLEASGRSWFWGGCLGTCDRGVRPSLPKLRGGRAPGTVYSLACLLVSILYSFSPLDYKFHFWEGFRSQPSSGASLL